MSWYEYFEHKRKLLIGGTVIICLTMLAITSRRIFPSYDSYWHLKMGLDWLESNLSPWRDHFSFTFYGEDIIGPPYMFEVLLGWVVSQLGFEQGFEVFKFGSFLAAFALVLLFLRRLRAPVVVYLLVLPLLVVILQFRSLVRPELISYSFSILAVMLYYRAGNKMTASTMLPILALMLVWSNYHSPIYGYIIFFGYFIDIALQQIRDSVPTSSWLKWFGWGLAIVSVGFLTPDFNHPLVQILYFSPEWKSLIQEYQSAFLYREVAAAYTLIAVAVITILLLLRNRQFGLFFVCVLLIFFSLDMVRLVTPSGIVILCIFAWTVSETNLGHRLQQLPRHLRRASGVTVMILFVLSLTSSVNMARSYMQENRTSGKIFPMDVVDYMVDQGISGRLFNSYSIGGYLIYRLSPSSQVYIDGRTNILYPLDHYYQFADAERSPEILRTEIEKHEINLAILKNKQRNFALVKDSGALGLDYPGIKFSLFTRDNPNFPLIGTLLAYPACWNADMYSALEDEQVKAISILPVDSVFLEYIQFVLDYSRADDRTLFLSTLEENNQWTAFKLRFAAYQALGHNLDAIAHELFAGVAKKEFSDFLGGALAQARLGEMKTAEQLLDAVTRQSWSDKLSEISVLYALLEHIRQNSTLELIDDSYVDRLAEEIGAGLDSTFASIPDPSLFCPNA